MTYLYRIDKDIEEKINEHSKKYGSKTKGIIDIALRQYFESLEVTDRMLKELYEKETK